MKLSPEEMQFARSGDVGKIELPLGVVWKLLGTEGNPPYLKVSCSVCCQMMDTESADPDKVVFKHCCREDRPEQELLDKLVRVQIQRGYRRKPTLMQKVTREVPALMPIF